jgi:dynein heavy chain
LGPLTGDRELIVEGINFPENKVQIKFTNGHDEEIVDGEWISSTQVSCITAGFEKYGAQEVDVKVAIGNEMFTVNRVHYKFYDDTLAANCVAFGSGLDGCVAGRPGRFLLQAKDTKNAPRTSGTDDFQVELRRKIPMGGGKVEKYTGKAVDHDDGLYTLEYIAPMPGDFSLHVTLNGEGIRGSPFEIQASDPWIPGPGCDGLPPACGENRREAQGGGKAWFTWTDMKGSETAVSVFYADEYLWEANAMSGKPPPPSAEFSMVPVGEGGVSCSRMMMFGGHDLR